MRLFLVVPKTAAKALYRKFTSSSSQQSNNTNTNNTNNTGAVDDGLNAAETHALEAQQMVEEASSIRQRASFWKHVLTSMTCVFAVFVIVLTSWFAITLGCSNRMNQAAAEFNAGVARTTASMSIMSQLCNARQCVAMDQYNFASPS